MPTRYGKAKTAYLKTLSHLTEKDLAEIETYRQFLKDMSAMTPSEIVEKYSEYMGFSKEDGAYWIGKKEQNKLV